MEKKEVVWTLPAKNDLQQIFNYLSEVADLPARRIVENIVTHTRLLGHGFEKIGQQEPLLKNRKKNYRYLVVGNYKIIYNSQDNKIIIHAIFDTRQHPKKLKKL